MVLLRYWFRNVTALPCYLSSYSISNKFYSDFKYFDEARLHNPKTARQMLEYWLAVDVYTECGNEVQEVMDFIGEINTERIVWVSHSANVLL